MSVNVSDTLGRVQIVDVDTLVGAAGGEQVAIAIHVHLEQVAVLVERALELTQPFAVANRVLTNHAILRYGCDHVLGRVDAQIVERLLLRHVALTHKLLLLLLTRRRRRRRLGCANHDRFVRAATYHM